MLGRKRELTSPELNSDSKKHRTTSGDSFISDPESDSSDSSGSCYQAAMTDQSIQASTYVSAPVPLNSMSLNQNDYAGIAAALQSLMLPAIQTAVENGVKSSIQAMKAEIDSLTLENKAIRSENEQLRVRVAGLERSADDAEQYSRRNCLRIAGIPEKETKRPNENNDGPDDSDGPNGLTITQHEDTDQIVLDLAKEIGVSLSLSDIDRSHRIGKRAPDRTRAIIVKFATYRARASFFSSRKTLKSLPHRSSTYINEDLTQYRTKLLYEARLLVKGKQLAGAWSWDGALFVKDNKDRKQRISSITDLHLACTT